MSQPCWCLDGESMSPKRLSRARRRCKGSPWCRPQIRPPLPSEIWTSSLLLLPLDLALDLDLALALCFRIQRVKARERVMARLIFSLIWRKEEENEREIREESTVKICLARVRFGTIVTASSDPIRKLGSGSKSLFLSAQVRAGN